MDEKLLSRQEAAKFLGISKSMLDKLTKQKKIPYIKFCRRPLFRKEDLEHFINQHVIQEENK